MSLDIEELRLDESYSFHVNVDDGVTRYAADLDLSPAKLILKVMGEQTAERKCDLFKESLETLRCYALNGQFLLSGLRLRKARVSTIQRQPEVRGFFECVFEVDYAFYLPGHYHPDPHCFSGIDILSSTLSSWIGSTNKQEAIIQRYLAHENVFEDADLLREVITPIAELGALEIGYNVRAFRSSREHKVGMDFPPSMSMHFAQKRTAAETGRFFEELYALLAFITGGELDIERVAVGDDCSRFASSQAPSLYYAREKMPPRGRHVPILFPLNHDVRFGGPSIQKFPVEVFGAFFCLSLRDRQRFEKYCRYRRRQNMEERFLGYFRLLEALCRRGREKDGARKYIEEFLATIPVEILNRWKYKKDDIAAICQLRNDIVHANEYESDERTLSSVTIFVEVLLVLALFSSLGITLDDSVRVISRLDEYRTILMPNPGTEPSQAEAV